MLKRTVKSCGPDASMVGVKSAEGKSARPGADEPAILRRRRQPSPILRGDHEISRKAIAQGMSDCLRCPVCSCALSFAQFAHETAGAARIRHSLLPLLWRDNETQASGRSCRENADVQLLFEQKQNSHTVIARSRCDEAIHLATGSAVKWIASLALAMTADGRCPELRRRAPRPMCCPRMARARLRRLIERMPPSIVPGIKPARQGCGCIGAENG